MLDIKRIRTDARELTERLNTRGGDFSSDIARITALDEKRRALLGETEAKKAELNAASKEIPVLKKAGQDTTELLEKLKKLSDEIAERDTLVKDIDEELSALLLRLPNIPNDSLPVGTDDSANEEQRKWGKLPAFDFEPKPHWELGEALGILDPAAAAKVTGTRFHFYRGAGARLERAVINFFMDTHALRGYTEILPPYMVNRASMTGTGQLPKFEEDAFKLHGSDYFLVPTAEVPVTNLHRDEILDGDSLTISYCAYSACFRAEGGSAGRDQRGLIRQHQFNKVELVKFTKPEDSYKELELLTADAEHVLQLLGLPYRVVKLSTGDLGNSSAMTYDLEVWMPSYNRYVEISSCSNFEDYQARRANIRFRRSKTEKPEFVHTLNGSGLAVGRTVAAIMECCQQDDGSVVIPKALVGYMGGKERISNE